MGKKTPPREPDYTQQRAEFASAEAANRRQQAGVYNAEVSDYNDQLRESLNSLNGFGNTLNDLTIRDVDRFDEFDDRLGDFRTEANGLTFDTPTPSWSSSVQSPYGAVTVEVPTLTSIDNSTRNRIDSTLTNFTGDLENLRSRREQEETRVADFRTGLLSELGNINNQLGDLTIADNAQMTALSSALGDIDTRRNTFSSSILDQLYPSGFSQVGRQYTTATETLNDLRAARAAEESRIDAYRNSLRSGFDNLSGTFDDLTIADEQGITDLQRLIDQRQLDASRFDSELDFDFTNSLNNYQNLEDRLAGLRSDRNAELARIETAEDAARAAALNLEGALDTTDIYDLNRLNSLTRQIDAGQEDFADFSSELDFDFSNEIDRFGAVETALQSLLNRRSQVLAEHGSDINSILGNVNDAELYNESAFTGALDEFGDLETALNRFTGSDTNDLRYALDDARNTAQGRLDDLHQFRDDFESDLQTELAALNDTAFYELDDFNTYDARAEELASILDQSGATQATDELAAFRERLSSERSRLQTARLNDGSAALTPQQRVQELLGSVSSGVMTPEQYLAILAGIEEEEQSAGGSGFSGNILRL